jgi:hypothetical protein
VYAWSRDGLRVCCVGGGERGLGEITLRRCFGGNTTLSCLLFLGPLS